VTQGTVATDPGDLLLPALEALRDEPVQVIAETGGPDPAELPAPANAAWSASCRSRRCCRTWRP
jgi:UDP:flavonoid glycosyltransferase YjiC (YdhE family)